MSSLEEAEELFYVANKYEVENIETLCEKFIIKTIKNYNLEDVMKFSTIFNLKNLTWLAQFVSSFFAHVQT